MMRSRHYRKDERHPLSPVINTEDKKIHYSAKKNEEENEVKTMKDTLLILCLIKNRKHMCQCTCYECHDNVPIKAALVIRKSSASVKFELGKIFKQSTQKHVETLFIKL